MTAAEFFTQFFTYERYAAEMVIMTLVFGLHFKKKPHFLFWTILFVASSLILFPTALVFLALPVIKSDLELYRKMTYLVYTVLTLPSTLFALLAYKEPWSNRIFLLLSVMVLRNISRTIFQLALLAIGQGTGNVSIYQLGSGDEAWQGLYYPFWALVNGTYYFFIRKTVTNKNFRAFDSHVLLLFLLSLPLSLLMSVLQNRMQKGDPSGYFFALISHLISLGMTIAAQFLIVIATQRATEKQGIEQRIAVQVHEYDLLKQNMELINEKAHDLRHQIRVAKRGETAVDKEFLSEVEQSLYIYDKTVDTGNQELDFILVDAKFRASSFGIPIYVMADGKALHFLSRQHVISLFSNIIENAINYERRLPKEQSRSIRLEVAVKNGFLRIEEENPIGEAGEKTEEEKDSRYHGFGMLSMRRIVKSYDGMLSVKEEGGYFRLSITIPYPGDAIKA